jgi:hypothetical protein
LIVKHARRSEEGRRRDRRDTNAETILFIASGSFFIGQMKLIPEPIRIVPLIVVAAVSPLVVLLYWRWRVRLKQNLRGLLTGKPIEARPARCE